MELILAWIRHDEISLVVREFQIEKINKIG